MSCDDSGVADRSTWPGDDDTSTEGERIISASRIGTAVFVVASALAVVLPEDVRLGYVVLCLVLFAVGIVVFLMAFFTAVERSRQDAIGIGGLYFLAGSAPVRVQVTMMSMFGVQSVTAVTAASLRPFTSLAVAVLVPMFGLGLAGLWGARYGVFESRFDD